jgi:hypothetical protein
MSLSTQNKTVKYLFFIDISGNNPNTPTPVTMKA